MAKRRTRRPRTKDVKDQTVKYSEPSNVKAPSNDPEWYVYDKEMFDGVISMPTLEFKGAPTPWKSNVLNNGQSPVSQRFKSITEVNFHTPTIAGYLMNPGLENSYLNQSLRGDYTAVNVAARKMYAELSASNAKTSMYAPQDISTLILALGQVIAMATHLKRLYGIANYFNFYSRKVPADIYDAMGVTGYSTVRNNLADFRNEVNQLIAKIDTINFPAGLSYFKKCKYIYENVFVDRDEKMITYHVMAPRSTWIIDEQSYDQGTILSTKETMNRSPEQLIRYTEEMVEAILTSSTFNYIFADIINLANRNVLATENLSIEAIPIDYVINPVYSEQFNWQIMNMNVLPFPNGYAYNPLGNSTTPHNDVYPSVDTNRLIYCPVFRAAAGDSGVQSIMRWAKQIPIRLPDTEPSHDLFVELLAYTARPDVTIAREGDQDMGYLRYNGLPDYWCSNVIIVRPLDGSGQSGVSNIVSNYLAPGDWKEIAYASQFVHFPFLATINLFDNLALDVIPISRLSAYTQVDNNALDNLRYQTYLGLFSFKK